MKRSIFAIGLITLAAAGIYAQNSSVKASSSSRASAGQGTASIASGTQISGQLQNALDAKNARVGDEVVLKTTSAVKENGKTVVQKGSRLLGRVTEVQKKAKGNAESRVGVLFDRLEQGGQQLPITAVITSVTQARGSAAATANDDDTMAGGSAGMSSSTSARTSASGNGGLLGGVGSTVGGVVNGATNTVGNVVNTTGQTVGSTTRAVGNTVGGIQISGSTDASAGGGSILSVSGGDLKLDKGSLVNVQITSTTSAKVN